MPVHRDRKSYFLCSNGHFISCHLYTLVGLCHQIAEVLGSFGPSLSVSVLRGPRSFGTLYNTSAYGLSITSALDLVVFPTSSRSLSVLSHRTRSLIPRSEVLFGVLSDVGAFRLSPTSALWSLGPSLVGLCTFDRGPRSSWSFFSRTRSFEVRGPGSLEGSLRRRRFCALSDVRALVSVPFPFRLRQY